MAVQTPADHPPTRQRDSVSDKASPRPQFDESTEPPIRQRHRPPRRAFAVVLLAAVIGVGLWLAPLFAPMRGERALNASGTVEADEVLLSFEVIGRISAILVQEGQYVNAGDVVARLDDSTAQLQFRQADAAMRQQLDLQMDKLSIRTPVSGTITRLPAHAGEVASPGQTIATVADLSSLRLTVYVPESDLGHVALRQVVVVTTDPFPGREFVGVVTAINQKAEFTPRNVQTQRDRQSLVFGVKVQVENPSQALKPGLPVDVRFVQE